jgi:hypothetical protein
MSGRFSRKQHKPSPIRAEAPRTAPDYKVIPANSGPFCEKARQSQFVEFSTLLKGTLY